MPRPPTPRPPHGESSTLRGFIPRMAAISLLGGLGVLTHKNGHRNTDTDARTSDLSRTQTGLGVPLPWRQHIHAAADRQEARHSAGVPPTLAARWLVPLEDTSPGAGGQH